MALKYSFTMSDADVAKGIIAVGKRSAAIRVQMHQLAVSILSNWAKSGDVKPAKERAELLYEKCDDAFKQKVVNWFGKYAGFEFDTETSTFSYTETKISVETVQQAREKDMFKLTPDAQVKAFDLREKLLSLIQQAEKRRQSDKFDPERDNIDPSLLKLIKADLTGEKAEAA